MTQVDLATIAENAACLWEAILDADPTETTQGDGFPHVMRFLAQNEGMAQLRTDVVRFAVDAEFGFSAAQEAGFPDPFDWEFCPWFVANCLQWCESSGVSLRPDYLELCKAHGAESTGRDRESYSDNQDRESYS